MMKVKKRALISVSDKTGVLTLASQLINLEYEIISTGGTYAYLYENGLNVIEVSDITGFPEILSGRVKTLNPFIHGAILAKKDDKNHQAELKKYDIENIDIVCVNLYPFESVIMKENFTLDEAIENIDIGGVTLIRAAAKNFQYITLVTSYHDYDRVLAELHDNGNVSTKTRLYLARKGFNHTAYYDNLVGNYLLQQENQDVISFTEEATIAGKLIQTLRYGENPHQKSAFYADNGNLNGLLASFKQLQGKELSYNNLVDADTAWECVKQYSFLPQNVQQKLRNRTAACVIVKHANPCGVALGTDTIDCYTRATSCDPVSSFGGIIAFNVEVDEYVAKLITQQFVEVLIAPKFSSSALVVLAHKPNLRLLQIDLVNNVNTLEYKRIGGGILTQTTENKVLELEQLKIVTAATPDTETMLDLYFAWTVARFVKSNAIILTQKLQTIGIGAGQTSRIDSTQIALSKAQRFGFAVAGCACASDAFFPFRDNVDILAANGVKAIIQPGGSIRDKEIFAAANEHSSIMVLAGYRIFRH